MTSATSATCAAPPSPTWRRPASRWDWRSRRSNYSSSSGPRASRALGITRCAGRGPAEKRKTFMTIDVEQLRKDLGRKIEDEDTVTEAPLKAMIATFDRQEKAPGPGEPIAPGWHLCFLHS